MSATETAFSSHNKASDTAAQPSAGATSTVGAPVGAPLARLRSFVGCDVTIMTLADRYQGRLTAVHPKAVWLELRDDCLIAVTEPVLSVALRLSIDARR